MRYVYSDQDFQERSREQSGLITDELQLRPADSDPDPDNRNIMYLNVDFGFGVYDATKLDKPISIPVICDDFDPLLSNVRFAGYGSFSYGLPEGWGGRNGDIFVSTGVTDRTTAFVEPNNTYTVHSAYLSIEPEYDVLELSQESSVALGDYTGDNYPLKMTVDVGFPQHNSFYNRDKSDRIHYTTLKAYMADTLGLREIGDSKYALMPGGPDQYLLPYRDDMVHLPDVSNMYNEQYAESHYDGFTGDEFDEYFDANYMTQICADYTRDILGVSSIEFDKNNPNKAVFVIDDARKFNAGLLSSMMTGTTVNFEIEDSKGIMLQRGAISAEKGITNIGPYKSEENYDKTKDESKNNSKLQKLYALRDSVDNDNRTTRSDSRSNFDFNVSVNNKTVDNKSTDFKAAHDESMYNKLKNTYAKYDNIKTNNDKSDPDYNTYD